jgi:hypothetical protein
VSLTNIGYLLYFLLVITSCCWMATQAVRTRLSIDGRPYRLHNGAVAWVLAGLVIWVLAWPWFIVRRYTSWRPAQRHPGGPSRAERQAEYVQWARAELGKLDALKAAGEITEREYADGAEQINQR